MAFARLASIPMDHVRAEVAAFPLASESALRLHLIGLDPSLRDSTGQLWRDAERALLGSFPAFSVDECVIWRDRLWFGEQSARNVPLAVYLRRVANQFLRVQGPVAIPGWNLDSDEDGLDPGTRTALARRAFLWLSFALPPDLLLAAVGERGQSAERIETMSPTVEQILRDRGYAETHLHVSVALDFSVAWVGALHAIARNDFKSEAFKAPGAGVDEGVRLGWWLLLAGLTRFVLANYLAQSGQHASFAHFVQTALRRRVIRVLNVSGYAVLTRLLSQIRTGRLSDAVDFELAKRIYRILSRINTRELPERPEAIFGRDPIGCFMTAGGNGGTPEVRFCRAALAYITPIGTRATRDELFAELFWQYVRVRGLLYRHVVQRPMTPGLQWFIRFFDRSKPIRRGTLPYKLTFHSAAQIGGANRGLRSLEMRAGPERDRSATLKYVEKVFEVGLNYRNSDPRANLETGVVFHFPKLREGGATEGRPAAHWRGGNGDPRVDPQVGSGNPSGYRFAVFYLKRLEEAMSVEWLLRCLPRSLEVVRGIDVCTDELGVPNWVLAPLVERVRRAAADGATALRRFGGPNLPAFRTTVHAGEDFVHLLTGLRHVDEAIEAYRLSEGDRIGHGLALGVDPRAWARRSCCVPMPREERLFDLTWEWTRYARQLVAAAPTRLVFLERQIAALSQKIFLRTLLPIQVDQLCRDLRDPFRLWLAGFPDRRPVPALRRPDQQGTRLGLLCEFLSSPEVFQRGRQPVVVETESDAEALEKLQSSLRRQVGAMGLTVEVNPVSNLLVGDLGDLTAHPLWRMNPPLGDGDAPPVPVCIGSDDPLVFASNLRLEYQWIHDALVLAGLSNEEAEAWLDRVRASGMTARFTLPNASGQSIRSPVNMGKPSQPMLL